MFNLSCFSILRFLGELQRIMIVQRHTDINKEVNANLPHPCRWQHAICWHPYLAVISLDPSQDSTDLLSFPQYSVGQKITVSSHRISEYHFTLLMILHKHIKETNIKSTLSVQIHVHLFTCIVLAGSDQHIWISHKIQVLYIRPAQHHWVF